MSPRPVHERHRLGPAADGPPAADARSVPALRRPLALRARAPRDGAGSAAASGLRQLERVGTHLIHPVMVCSVAWRIEWVNQAFTHMTGYAPEEVVGHHPAGLTAPPGQASNFHAEMRRALLRDGHWEGEVLRRRRDGQLHPVRLCASAVRDADGRTTHFVAVYTDLSHLRQADERIRQLALHDPITGLPNRMMLIDRLSQALRARERDGRGLAVLCLGLDGLDLFIGAHGHDAGDMLMAELARRLRGSLRSLDTLARTGADEFVVLLEGMSTTPRLAACQAEAVALKLQCAAALPHVLDAAVHHGSASIGISLADGAVGAASEVHQQASIAMHEARRAGRGSVRLYGPQAQRELCERVRLEHDLRQAIRSNQLALHLQAQVDAQGACFGAEALLRWQHPERGMVPPGRFIPLAEEGPLILTLGRWVLREACALLRRWADDPVLAGMDLSINMSGRQLAQPDVVDEVREALECTGAPARRLLIELTESAVLADPAAAGAKLGALRRMGVRISLDDFGTGQSSLAYLSRLPLDHLKIDRSFVDRMLEHPFDRVLVQTILRMAEGLDLDVIAEGVETAAQAELLMAMGCRRFQGYLFGRPVPVGQFSAPGLHAPPAGRSPSACHATEEGPVVPEQAFNPPSAAPHA